MKTERNTTCTMSGVDPCAAAKICLLNRECFHCAFSQWIEAMGGNQREAATAPWEGESALAAAA